MTILDANILLYAYDSEAEGHVQVRRWLEAQFQAREAIGLPWLSLWAFLRISTNARINRHALPLREAFTVLQEIQRMPRASIVSPGAQHAEFLQDLAVRGQAAGARMTDAVLAAIAIEHGAQLASTDRDFSRFPDLRWVNPLD